MEKWTSVFASRLKGWLFLFTVLLPVPAQAAISGICSDCHTMHNSQGGQVMADFAGESGPNFFLTRGSCTGCHAQGTGEKIITVGPNQIPQVYHNAGTDLAAGNFAYISGAKGSPGGADDRKGHNVLDAVNQDGNLHAPPGGIVQFGHDSGIVVNSGNLTCAGNNGCHGYRYSDGVQQSDKIRALGGAHHANQDGKLTVATTPANSYRFLLGVKGLENPVDRWQNRDAASHNEYFGVASPGLIGCSNLSCHREGWSGPVVAPNHTMGGFCATCHGNFHTLKTSTSSGIGTVASSPFVRHPSDIAIKNQGEYANYTTYNVQAPVARQAVPDNPSGVVAPGSDAVMCLSCHMAHASPYPSMLRWDYTLMIAGNAGEAAGTGCFVCHTTKDD